MQKSKFTEIWIQFEEKALKGVLSFQILYLRILRLSNWELVEQKKLDSELLIQNF